MLLLDNGAMVDAATVELYTPLHIAAKEGHDDVVQLLLDRGADHSLPTSVSQLALHPVLVVVAVTAVGRKSRMMMRSVNRHLTLSVRRVISGCQRYTRCRGTWLSASDRKCSPKFNSMMKLSNFVIV